MGSGALLAALVVLWFVVLVPMVVTRGDSQSGKGEPTSTGRTLQRRRTATPVTSVDTERVAVDRGALLSSGELKVDVHKLRRRTLGGLVALSLLALAGAFLLSAWVWPVQVLLDLAVVGYVLVLRKVARRERMAARRAARAAVREARMATARPVRERRPEPVQEAAPVLPHPSLPLAPVHPLRPGRVVAARTATPSGWQHSAVVGLDDDDIGFADIDEYRPARVVNG
ncbi:hypothetical protein [Petropleomorpha daqingensis]|uniref:Uncharacterized protein n=1 Tax=Petropleomorpha daqingensis TaxID=2026353 RepID=A0A853CIW8_9ACTN|nr:hypothetical protein [Petropleomorpha daqingensis]NYJ06228.1 hypothetical protein [Petropleomorpha daqingensis]